MENKYLISVIIPCYNRENEVSDTINSLLNQNIKNYELVVVDDGSLDNTIEKLKQFSKRKNVNIYSIKNSERGAARNFGALKAKGKYLNFFDSDDIAKNNHIECATSMINSLSYPEVFHLSYEHEYLNGDRKKIILDGKINSKIITRNILSCNGVFIRNDIFNFEKFSENRDLSGSEDWDLWVRLANKYNFISSKSITTILKDHENRSMKTQNFNKVSKRINILLKNFNDRDKSNLSFINLAKVNSELYSYLSLSCIIQTRKKYLSFKYLLLSFFYYIPNIFTKRFIYILYKILLK